MNVETLQCPNCGASLSRDQKECEFCGSPVYITNGFSKMSIFDLAKRANAYTSMISNDPSNMDATYSFSMIKIQQGMYDDAINALGKVVSNTIGNADAMFYLAVATLKGKKPFLVPRKDIDLAENYLINAIGANPNPIYLYMLGFIRQDHHERKGFRMNEKSSDFYKEALNAGLSYLDVENLHGLLKTDIPANIKQMFGK